MRKDMSFGAILLSDLILIIAVSLFVRENIMLSLSFLVVGVLVTVFSTVSNTKKTKKSR